MTIAVDDSLLLLSLPTVGMVLDVFFVAALILRLILRFHVRSSSILILSHRTHEMNLEYGLTAATIGARTSL
jgi:hypothetical protein